MVILRRGPAVFLLLAALSSWACVDLNVTNINEPDSERALATPGDVESLIGNSYNTWFTGSYGRIPRVGIVNNGCRWYGGNPTVLGRRTGISTTAT